MCLHAFYSVLSMWGRAVVRGYEFKGELSRIMHDMRQSFLRVLGSVMVKDGSKSCFYSFYLCLLFTADLPCGIERFKCGPADSVFASNLSV